MTTQLDISPTETDQLVALKSVTDGDIPRSVYYLNFSLGNFLNGYQVLPDLLPARLPGRYTWAADRVLYDAGKFEGRWGSAVAIAGSKVAARAFELKSDKPALMQRYHDMLHDIEGKGKGPVYLFKKISRDYLSCDNGAFLEVDRIWEGAGSRIDGLYVLDSRRCRRTGVPEIPVIYIDLLGYQHELRDYQVVDIVDQPETTAELYGVGECAARRAYKTIRMMNAVDQLRYEQVAGARPLALDFLTGITEEQIEEVLKTNEAQRQAKGLSVYGGTVLIPLIKPNGIDHVRVPMAELPKDYDSEKERRLALGDYANAIGIDSQELLPLTGQALGTGAQSQVLDEKEQGKGLVTLMLDIIHAMQHYVLPDAVTFAFSEKADYRDQKAKADIFSTYATATSTLVDKGIANPDQAMQKLVDEDQMPKEFLVQDQTLTETVDSTEKPQAEPDEEDVQAVQEAQDKSSALPQPVTTKELVDFVHKIETRLKLLDGLVEKWVITKDQRDELFDDYVVQQIQERPTNA
jgi:hypothetical protein